MPSTQGNAIVYNYVYLKIGLDLLEYLNLCVVAYDFQLVFNNVLTHFL